MQFVIDTEGAPKQKSDDLLFFVHEVNVARPDGKLAVLSPGSSMLPSISPLLCSNGAAHRLVHHAKKLCGQSRVPCVSGAL